MTKIKKQEILNGVRKLVDFKLEYQINKKRFPEFYGEGYDLEDENAPFFSESCLYNLFGKEDARTILALIRNILYAVGLTDEDLIDLI